MLLVCVSCQLDFLIKNLCLLDKFTYFFLFALESYFFLSLQLDSLWLVCTT
jgi:hypothetical protein